MIGNRRANGYSVGEKRRHDDDIANASGANDGPDMGIEWDGGRNTNDNSRPFRRFKTMHLINQADLPPRLQPYGNTSPPEKQSMPTQQNVDEGTIFRASVEKTLVNSASLRSPLEKAPVDSAILDNTARVEMDPSRELPPPLSRPPATGSAGDSVVTLNDRLLQATRPQNTMPSVPLHVLATSPAGMTPDYTISISSGNLMEPWLVLPLPLADLTDQIERETAILCGGGRFGDVYKCNYMEASGLSSLVAVKSIRSFVSSGDLGVINRDLQRELGIWRRLDCNRGNIVPLLGTAKGFGPLDAIVSAWMPNGTLHSFLKDEGVAYSDFQRLSMLLGIGSCLEYLHSIPVLHGDLTSCNILIDEKCHPRLTDFGLSSAVETLQTGMTYLVRSSTDPGALRWAAPESFDDECKPNPSADIYSFGCIMLEVLSGKIPWDGKPERVVIGLKIVQHRFPDRPTSPKLKDIYWGLMVNCWSLPEERPSVEQVVKALTGFQCVERRRVAISSGFEVRPRLVIPPSCSAILPTAMRSTAGPSRGKKRALLIAIECVRGYKYGYLGENHFARRDVDALRKHLEARGYAQGTHLVDLHYPTRQSILNSVDTLVKDAPDDCQIFFYYSGHVLPEFGDAARPGRNIITEDEELISSDVLNERLVAPLKRVKGAKLFTLFDCNDSETILDLHLGQGPKTYSQTWPITPARLLKAVATSIAHLYKSLRSAPRLDSRKPKYKHRREKEAECHVQVISLSACRDSQVAYDDHERKLTFTKMFLDTLTVRPDLTWLELRNELQYCISEMHARWTTRLQRLRERDGVVLEEYQWIQEPRYNTSPHVDLTTKVTF